MKMFPLGKICKINPSLSQRPALDQKCSFVPMDCVDDIAGKITHKQVRRITEVQKGYTPFQNGDVLFAKITPCMENGKCAIATDLLNGIGYGSTEFHIIRADANVVPEWIFYYLRQERIRQQAECRMTGSAGQRRVPTLFLEELAIPLPAPDEQKRIVTQLDKADRLRRTRRYVQQLSDNFLQSVFLEMFGEERHVDTIEFLELFAESPKNGLYLPAEKYGSGTPIIRIDNFYGGQLSSPTEFKRVRANQSEIEDFAVFNDDILINRVNSIEYLGKCALVRGITEKTIYESNMMRIKVDTSRLSPTFVTHYLSSSAAYHQILIRAKRAVNQASINQTDVETLKIPLPNIKAQERFETIVRRMERLRTQQREAERQAEHLFQTLLHQTFSALQG